MRWFIILALLLLYAKGDEISLDCSSYDSCGDCTKISLCLWCSNANNGSFCIPGAISGPENIDSCDDFYFLQCQLSGNSLGGSFSYSIYVLILLMVFGIIMISSLSLCKRIATRREDRLHEEQMSRKGKAVQMQRLDEKRKIKEKRDVDRILGGSNNSSAAQDQRNLDFEVRTTSPDPYDSPNLHNRSGLIQRRSGIRGSPSLSHEENLSYSSVSVSMSTKSPQSQPQSPQSQPQSQPQSPQSQPQSPQSQSPQPQPQLKPQSQPQLQPQPQSPQLQPQPIGSPKEVVKKVEEEKLKIKDPTDPDFSVEDYKAMMIARYEEEQRQNAEILRQRREAAAAAATTTATTTTG